MQPKMKSKRIKWPLILSVGYLMLQGCSTTVPLTMKFPDPPPSLMRPAPNLEKLETNNISDLLFNANENYGKFYELKEKYLAWQEWYKSQKEIFEDVQK